MEPIKKMILIAIIASLLFSCSKDHIVYSCDQELNQWVIENKDRLSEISRETYANIPFEKQIPLFRSFSPTQKARLWKEKFELLLEIPQLTTQEKKHLSLLAENVNPSIYGNIDKKKEFWEFSLKWEEHAREELYWNDYEVFIYTNTLLLEDEFIDLTSRYYDEINPGGEEKDCTCLYDIYCSFGLQLCNKRVNCKTVEGCGIAGTSNCTGLCD